jgi:hypothetical protein
MGKYTRINGDALLAKRRYLSDMANKDDLRHRCRAVVARRDIMLNVATIEHTQYLTQSRPLTERVTTNSAKMSIN